MWRVIFIFCHGSGNLEGAAEKVENYVVFSNIEFSYAIARKNTKAVDWKTEMCESVGDVVELFIHPES